jgi:hypothetical protein
MREANPLLALYLIGGESAVDAWIEAQTEWSAEELVEMLRELAIEIATAGEHPVDDEDDDDADDDDSDDDDDDDSGDEDSDDGDDDDDGDDGEAEGSEDEDRGRQITTHALDLLKARAQLGLLDIRATRYLPTDSNDEDLN